jgi:hypothetical protein
VEKTAMPNITDLDWIAFRASTRASRRFSRSVRLVTCLLVGLACTACSESDIRGAYRVEILIEQARAPIEAILVLTSTHLDIESLPQEARGGIAQESGDSQDYQADPNSCLILPSNDPRDDAPRSVTFFEARVQGGEANLPFSIFETDEQRMEVVKLQFFANALGGEIIFYEPDGERPGRLIGDRLGDPSAHQCVEAMEKFLARITEIVSPD